jgi:tetratricopeptide (TPR) repeat protein
MVKHPIRPSLFQRLSHRHYLLATLLLVSPVVVSAQSGGGVDTTGTGGMHVITGRLIFPSGQRVDSRLKIRLESPGVGDLTVLSDVNGNFTFQSLRPGNYTVTVEGGDNFETARESIFIEPSVVTTRRGPTSMSMARPFNVQFYMRPKNEAATNRPGVVNAALASVPKPAVAFYEKGLEFARANEADKAIDQFRRAVELHPAFGLALNELGVQYMKKGQYEKAADALAKVVQLSPDASEPRLNYGIVLYNLGKVADAEIQLREVVKKNDHSFPAHYYLGLTLIKQSNYEGAEVELRRAIELGGPRASRSHYILGGLYWKVGKLQQAVDELEAYLKLEPKAPDAERVRGTIKDLRAKL